MKPIQLDYEILRDPARQGLIVVLPADRLGTIGEHTANLMAVFQAWHDGQWYGVVRDPEIENDLEWRQLATYIVVHDADSAEDEPRYFAYARGTESESRLDPFLSLGIGGHVEVSDVARNLSQRDTPATALSEAAARELAEEAPQLQLTSPPVYVLVICVQGEDEDMLHRVHAGIVYHAAARLDATKPSGKVGKLESYSLSALQDLADRGRLERWSELLLPHLRSWNLEEE